MTEKTPLLHHGRNSGSGPDPQVSDLTGLQGGRVAGRPAGPKLGVMFGVVIPTLLSMFSVVVFLRVGVCHGQTKPEMIGKLLLGKADLELQDLSLIP